MTNGQDASGLDRTAHRVPYGRHSVAVVHHAGQDTRPPWWQFWRSPVCALLLTLVAAAAMFFPLSGMKDSADGPRMFHSGEYCPVPTDGCLSQIRGLIGIEEGGKGGKSYTIDDFGSGEQFDIVLPYMQRRRLEQFTHKAVDGLELNGTTMYVSFDGGPWQPTLDAGADGIALGITLEWTLLGGIVWLIGWAMATHRYIGSWVRAVHHDEAPGSRTRTCGVVIFGAGIAATMSTSVASVGGPIVIAVIGAIVLGLAMYDPDHTRFPSAQAPARTSSPADLGRDATAG